MENTPKTSDSLNNLIPQFGETTTNISPADKRQNFNTYLAGTLALMLWGTLIGVIFWHALAINYISKSLWGTNSSIEEVQKKSETSSALINDTAKTLYPDFSQSLKKQGSKTAKMYIVQQLQQFEV